MREDNIRGRGLAGRGACVAYFEPDECDFQEIIEGGSGRSFSSLDSLNLLRHAHLVVLRDLLTFHRLQGKSINQYIYRNPSN